MKQLLKKMVRATGYEFRHRGRARQHQPYGLDHEVDTARLLGHPPRTVLDVGANVGETSRGYALAFPGADIHAFEPVHATFDQLKTNTADLPRVTPHRLALSNQNGTQEIRRFDSNSAATLSSEAAVHSQSQGTETIQTLTLDAFSQEHGLGEIDLLKIDTEGHELAVLEGAAGLLKAGKVHNIFAEFWTVSPGEPLPGTSLLALNEVLQAQGMYLVAIYTDRIERQGRFFGLRNALFTRWRPVENTD